MIIYFLIIYKQHTIVSTISQIRTKLCDKRDDFSFNIVNFPFIYSNIPAEPVYGKYLSHLMRKEWVCGSFHDYVFERFAANKEAIETEVPSGYAEVITSSDVRSLSPLC